jgi:membrane associated rhomboid family serine protease
MIPLRDLNPTRRFPMVTIALITLNVLFFLYQLYLQQLGQLDGAILQLALVPYNVTHSFNGEVVLDFLRAMFMHGGWMHLIGNMLYLWIFGDNIEDVLGVLGFAGFYLVCGVAASLLQVVVQPNSTIPMLGASGAIAGVLGGYLILFPQARVLTLIPLGWYVRLTEVPAIFVLGFWFVLQLLNGVFSFGVAQMGGVAYFAHIGGFVAGLVIALLVRGPVQRRMSPRYWGE